MATTPEPQPSRDDPVTLRTVWKAAATGIEEATDALAVERWLRIMLNGREVAAVMASPGHEQELGAGFLLTQGYITLRRELLSVTASGDAVRIVVPVELSLALAQRIGARASCGGVAQADEDLLLGLAGAGPVVSAARLHEMARAMGAAQAVYRRTGGTHGAGIFTAAGEMIAVREDVGRHNAADKAIGHCLLADLPLHDKVLVISGRISREIAASAVRAGVPIIASMSAPTDAGVEVAARCGLTVVGFLRGRRMNIYARPERIDFNPA